MAENLTTFPNYRYDANQRKRLVRYISNKLDMGPTGIMSYKPSYKAARLEPFYSNLHLKFAGVVPPCVDPLNLEEKG